MMSCGSKISIGYAEVLEEIEWNRLVVANSYWTKMNTELASLISDYSP